MARLPTNGVMIATPALDQVELKRVFDCLQLSKHFGDSEIRNCHFEIGVIIGNFSRKQHQLAAEPIAKALLLLHENLARASRFLASLDEGGPHSDGGWLFEAAQAVEPFLSPEMRSPSREACFQRLKRSKRNLKRSQGQNRSDR